MTPRIPSLKALRALEAVTRLHSITLAAEELNVSPAAISQQLKTLENDFGAKLVERKDGEFVISEFVQEGLPDIKEGFNRLLLGVKKMREHGVSRPLTVTVEPSFAATWLLSRLPRYYSENPDARIRLDPSLEMIDLAHHHDIDMGIRYSNGDHPGYRVDKLMSEEVVVVCSPDLVNGNIPLKTSNDLKWHTLLHDDFETADKSIPTWEMWLKIEGCNFEAKNNLHFPLTSMTVDAAALGQGVALISRVIASEHLASGRLVIPFGESVSIPTDFSYYLVCVEDIADRNDVFQFRSWILNEAQDSQLAKN